MISATPFNNSPSDLLSQIKLFQPAHNSTLPNPKVRDLESYFKGLEKRQMRVNKDEDPELYLKVSKEISKDIRENVLQYIMVRRTRNSIDKYYQKDLKRNNLEFPTVNTPYPVYYEFDDYINEVFDKTLELITRNLTFAKYRPLAIEYQKEPNIKFSNSQNMMGNFIKILLIKRLESGSYAFKKSIDNSINVHKQALETFIKRADQAVIINGLLMIIGFTVFAVLHFLSPETTIRAVDLILSLPLNNYGEVRVVIADNHSPDGSGPLLMDHYCSDSRVDVLLLKENMGFARGNNEAFRWIRDRYDPENEQTAGRILFHSGK